MTATAKLTQMRLSELVAPEHVLVEPEQLTSYEVDGLRPAAAVRPGSAEEVAAVVKVAAAENLAVVPAGGRTKLGIGMPPCRYDLALDLARLDRVVAYDPGDLTLSVEAGIPLSKLSEILAREKQTLPLAVPFTSQTTVGGTLASGVDSPLRQFYGTARDFVVGMEFVTGEGVLAKSGGRVVKNVTGYDLHKLMLGALGSLGVITRANFKTFPLTRTSRGFLASFESAGRALEMRARIAKSPLPLLTLEVLSPEVAQIFAQRSPKFLGSPLALPGTWLRASEWLLATAFGGTEALLKRYERDLSQIAAEIGATSSHILGEEDRPLVWGRLRECFPLLLDSSPATTILKLSALPSQSLQIVDRSQQIAASYELRSAAVIRGAGLIYFALLPALRNERTIGQLAHAASKIFRVASEAGVQATIPWCPRDLKLRVNVWGEPREDFFLMQRLKKTFDPRGILSPGRFVGGL